MKYPFLSIIVLCGVSQLAFAGTTITYDAHCKYYNSSQQLKYSGSCKANWGMGMDVDNKGNMRGTYQRYILTYPNGSEVFISINSNGSAYVNNIPSIPVKAKRGYEKVMTSEGEIFEFTEGSE